MGKHKCNFGELICNAVDIAMVDHAYTSLQPFERELRSQQDIFPTFRKREGIFFALY